ncbi:unnamed protein product [Caenorhabditis auriculariae]|uniref:Uncharacterized protein n=1 Tax=Caenorhabditis auriculariae TaxID=2777116 RepID=A0A8S1HTW6_9PELO|nr:unnamed protein product [Caenorhabditis auriculariae]
MSPRYVSSSVEGGTDGNVRRDGDVFILATILVKNGDGPEWQQVRSGILPHQQQQMQFGQVPVTVLSGMVISGIGVRRSLHGQRAPRILSILLWRKGISLDLGFMFYTFIRKLL